MPVQPAGLLHRQQVFAGNGLGLLGTGAQPPLDTFYIEPPPNQVLMPLQEIPYGLRLCRLAAEVGHIQGEKITGFDKLLDVAHIDVVGVNVVFAGKSVVADGFFHRRALLERAGADNRVFPI